MNKLSRKILRKLGIKFCYRCDKPLFKPYQYVRIVEETWSDGMKGYDVAVCKECRNKYYNKENYDD